MTDAEIMKALERCINDKYYIFPFNCLKKAIMSYAFRLIENEMEW